MCHTGWIYISAAGTTYETDEQRTWTLDIECHCYNLLGCSFQFNISMVNFHSITTTENFQKTLETQPTSPK